MGPLAIISQSAEPFADRAEAGRLLARYLADLKGTSALVLGIPRGGVVVAAQLAREIDGELDIALTRKLGSPTNPELAMGAVAENGEMVLEQEVVRYYRISADELEACRRRELAEIARRAEVFRRFRPRVALDGRVVVITDDGVATGSTMLAALQAARAQGPAKLICALPVGPHDTLRKLADQVDEVICLRVPQWFDAVGRFYKEFSQVSDEEVLEVLRPFAGTTSRK